MNNAFLESLRAETSAMHKALEQNRYAAALMSDSVTLDDYADYLEKMYGFVRVFEEVVLPQARQSFPGIEDKHPLLAADLQRLNRSVAGIALLPPDVFDSCYPNAAAVWGGLYVMEGSTLGGMMIYKHLHDRLGSLVEGKASYFTVYGNETGSRWRSFLERFCAIAEETLNERAVIEGAIDSFRLLHQWMGDKQPACP